MSQPAGLNVLEVEWQFTPPDLFEERTELSWSGYTFAVDAGKVVTRLETNSGLDTWPILANELHQIMHAQFLAAQVLSHVRFTLSKPTYARLRPDGSRDLFIIAESGQRLTFRLGKPDIGTTDAAGNVVYDSRMERIERRKSLARLAAEGAGDPVADSILRSYGAAVNDPGNELVHLYEILDALTHYFGSDPAARAALGISNADWRRLGALANGEPLTQGRHRGQHPSQLRDATDDELAEARGIAQAMIEGYLEHLAAPATP